MKREAGLSITPLLAEMRTWLFDFDNTLVALEPEVDWAASRVELEAYLRSEGVGPGIFAEYPKGNLVLYEALRGRLMEPRSGSALVTRDGLARRDPLALLRHSSEIIESFELRGVETAAEVPGASELLCLLQSRRRPVAIVTSNSSRTIATWLRRERLHGGVATVVGRDAMLPLKPAPASIARALEDCSVCPADAIFVGDAPTDLQAAEHAGVRFIGIATTLARRGKLTETGSSAVVSSLAEIGKAL